VTPELTIGILCYIKADEENQIRFTQRFIDSLRFVKMKYNLVIVDNGSTDKGHNFLKSLKPDCLITFTENLGVVHGYNTIMENSCTEYVYIPNADHVVSENSVENLLSAMKSNPHIFVAGNPDCRFVHDYTWVPPNVIPNVTTNEFMQDLDIYNSLDKWNQKAQIFIEKNNNLFNPKFPSNYMMTKDNWLKIGKFRMGFSYEWVAMDAFFHKDCERLGLMGVTYLGGLLYHDFHSNTPREPLTLQKSEYLKKLGARIG